MVGMALPWFRSCLPETEPEPKISTSGTSADHSRIRRFSAVCLCSPSDSEDINKKITSFLPHSIHGTIVYLPTLIPINIKHSCREIYWETSSMDGMGFTIPWDASMMGTFVVLNSPGGAKSFRPGLPPLGFVDPCAGTPQVACFRGHPPLGANGYWRECEAINIGIEKNTYTPAI